MTYDPKPVLSLHFFSDHIRAAGAAVGPHALQHGSSTRGRYSYHENPVHRYEQDFSSLPRDHRILSWKRDMRAAAGPRLAEEASSAVRGHRRSFHYDDRKDFTPSMHSYVKREISPAAARRSYDPSHYEPCDR